MTMDIQVQLVRAVLLADRWHDVKPVGSFSIESYGFEDEGRKLYSSGDSQGFRFNDGNGLIYGPLTSILAVRMGSAYVSESHPAVRSGV